MFLFGRLLDNEFFLSFLSTILPPPPPALVICSFFRKKYICFFFCEALSIVCVSYASRNLTTAPHPMTQSEKRELFAVLKNCSTAKTSLRNQFYSIFWCVVCIIFVYIFFSSRREREKNYFYVSRFVSQLLSHSGKQAVLNLWFFLPRFSSYSHPFFAYMCFLFLTKRFCFNNSSHARAFIAHIAHTLEYFFWISKLSSLPVLSLSLAHTRASSLNNEWGHCILLLKSFWRCCCCCSFW